MTCRLWFLVSQKCHIAVKAQNPCARRLHYESIGIHFSSLVAIVKIERVSENSDSDGISRPIVPTTMATSLLVGCLTAWHHWIVHFRRGNHKNEALWLWVGLSRSLGWYLSLLTWEAWNPFRRFSLPKPLIEGFCWRFFQWQAFSDACELLLLPR